jgi:hypothetical protein
MIVDWLSTQRHKYYNVTVSPQRPQRAQRNEKDSNSVISVVIKKMTNMHMYLGNRVLSCILTGIMH